MKIPKWAFAALILALTFVGVKCANAQEAEGHIGVTVNLTPTETNYGLLGDYKRVLGAWEFNADGQLQNGLQTTGLANLSAQRNFGSIGLKPYAEFVFSVDGRQQDYGFVGNFAVSGIDIAVGGSFRNADPVSDSGFDADGFTTRPGYNPDTGKWKDANTFSFDNAESLNLIAATSFPVFGFDTDVKASIPFKQLGDDTAYPQIITRSQRSVDFQGINFGVVADFRFQILPDVVQFEKSLALSATVAF